MTAESITLDGKEYKVLIIYPSRKRRFILREGNNSGVSIYGRKIRDIFGTEYGYYMTVKTDPQHPEEYDAFYEAISAPVESHRVIMPYGQGTLEFEAAIYSGEDMDKGVHGDTRQWDDLIISFEPIEPQRKPVET